MLVSLLNELYRQAIRDRGRMMYEYIRKMLSDGKNVDLAYLTFRHPLIDHMRNDDKTRPSYIQDKVFATAFIQTVGDLSAEQAYSRNEKGEIVMKESRLDHPVERFKTAVVNMHPTPLRSTLLGMVERAQLNASDSYTILEREVMDWFNNQMGALSRRYKSRQRKSLLVSAAIVTFFLNIDSIHLVHELRNDPVVRAELSGRASELVSQYERQVNNLALEANDFADTIPDQNLIALLNQINATRTEIQNSELPIGWGTSAAPLSWFVKEKGNYESNYDRRRNYPTFLGVVFYFFGIIISIFSLSMGAPFWFDVLKKLVNLRGNAK